MAGHNLDIKMSKILCLISVQVQIQHAIAELTTNLQLTNSMKMFILRVEDRVMH